MKAIQNFTPLNVATNSRKRGGGKKGSLTMINSKENGNRLVLSAELLETLDIQDDTIQLGFEGTTLVLGTNLPGTDNRFALRPLEKRKAIYCKAAVEEITRVQDIHFGDGVSFTWYKPIVDEYEGRPIVMFEREEGEQNG